MLDVFSKDARNTGGGGAAMFAGALKMLGVEPHVIEQLSTGLLTDVKALAAMRPAIQTVAGTLPELLARLEYLLQCTEAATGSDHPNAWGDYLDWRRAEITREIAAHDDRNPGNAGGDSDGGNAVAA